jgi:hypothetical protein
MRLSFSFAWRQLIVFLRKVINLMRSLKMFLVIMHDGEGAFAKATLEGFLSSVDP